MRLQPFEELSEEALEQELARLKPREPLFHNLDRIESELGGEVVMATISPPSQSKP